MKLTGVGFSILHLRILTNTSSDPLGVLISGQENMEGKWEISSPHAVKEKDKCKNIFSRVCVHNYIYDSFIELQEVKVSCSLVSDSCPMNCSLPGFSVHGILQVRVLE